MSLKNLSLDRLIFTIGVGICLGRLLYQPSPEPILVLALLLVYQATSKAFSLVRFKAKEKSVDKAKDYEARLSVLESHVRRLEADLSLRLMGR